jgi:hypothetical protein
MLSDRDRAILAFEHKRFRYPGKKDDAIRDTFDLSRTRYEQILNALIDDPAALEHDPMIVRRLQRLRDERSARRGGHLRAG